MKNTILFLTLVFLLVSCAVEGNRNIDNSVQLFDPDNIVTIRGTVTITRNDVPWNKDNFLSYEDYDGYCRSGTSPLHLSAYSDEHSYIGEAFVDYDASSADYSNGTYYWTLKIPEDKLPCHVHFVGSCYMRDVYHSGGIISTEKIWINDKNTLIDLGLINYNVVKLSGNLPITINGEALDEYSTSRINIMQGSNSLSSYETYINSNGDWSLNIFQPNSEIPATFQVETKQFGGIFKKVLNPANAINIYDTDLEVSFPDFASVNFEALALSGTLELPVADGRRLHIYLYYENYTGHNSDIILSWQEITWPEPDENGLFEWRAMIPVYPLPFNLIARTELIKDVGMYHVDRYQANTDIIITNTTDLSNIDLGDLQL